MPLPTITLPLPAPPHSRQRWLAPHGSSLALALLDAARRHDGLVVAVCHDTLGTQNLATELAAFAGDTSGIFTFPDWETLPYDLFPPHPDIVSQRIATLYRLPDARRGILVVPVATLMQRLPPVRYVAGATLLLERGQRYDIAAQRSRLEAAGYRSVPQVAEPGDFAVRGSIVDLYAMGSDAPYRIELLDDEIDTIRRFDPDTQRSRDPVERVDLLPAREFPLTPDSIRTFRTALRERFPIDPHRCPLYQDLREGATPAGIEYYLPLFFESTATLFDYLGERTLLVIGPGALEAADEFWQRVESRHEERAHDIERPILGPAELYLRPDELRAALNHRPRVDIMARTEAGAGAPMPHPVAADPGTAPVPMLPLNRKGVPVASDLAGFLAASPGPVLLAADSPGRREVLLGLLGPAGIRPEPVASWADFAKLVDATTIPRGDGDGARLAIMVAPLEQGFTLTGSGVTVLTERELFGDQARQERRRTHAVRDPETILRDLGELTDGAPIVHVDHGVGRYRGLVTLDAGGQTGEFLAIEYARGDRLYVPVAQLQRVSRYTGASPELAPLHALGGDAWERVRRRAAAKVRDVAAEMLALHAERAARPGVVVPVDRALVDQFGAGFPFELTADQAAAIDAVLADLAAPRRMDRLVCGDVGFGKTEVALRAAFAVASAGRQVAVLVPTTLLAQQHFRTFADRFADWPLRIEMLSRFRSAAESAGVLAALAEGRVDIVIGTHKLLQRSVRFKDLGLVIVDEEQRFGVRHKEQLKKLRAEVDLLTLTATPIPRTLNMSLAGLRDLSIIATPPAHRMAIKTFIGRRDPAVIREALQRELARGGQIYFLHNDVESIGRAAREVGELMPEARIRIAHGQMPERELEQVMLDFYRQRSNVLVCTTIIESGIDVPSANTIIIERADRFGLAQLHQLRGRVGRSHHRAYAYLMVPDGGAISVDAEKRLEALASIEDLGAGFTLATHDLEIRGAGELLGEEQSGQIEEIGFALYSELLDRAVRALREGRSADDDFDPATEIEVDLRSPALIPSDYLPDVHTRLTLYKRIAGARDDAALRDLQVEMIDRFGLLPEPLRTLFAAAALKLAAAPLGIRKLEAGPDGGRITFDERPAIDPLAVIRLIQGQPRTYALDGKDRLRFHRPLPSAADRIAALRELLDTFAAGSGTTAAPRGVQAAGKTAASAAREYT
ncbi:MAG: transcription-repair coupling factor [Lysobacterales bacterium]